MKFTVKQRAGQSAEEASARCFAGKSLGGIVFRFPASALVFQAQHCQVVKLYGIADESIYGISYS